MSLGEGESGRSESSAARRGTPHLIELQRFGASASRKLAAAAAAHTNEHTSQSTVQDVHQPLRQPWPETRETPASYRSYDRREGRPERSAPVERVPADGAVSVTVSSSTGRRPSSVGGPSPSSLRPQESPPMPRQLDSASGHDPAWANRPQDWNESSAPYRVSLPSISSLLGDELGARRFNASLHPSALSMPPHQRPTSPRSQSLGPQPLAINSSRTTTVTSTSFQPSSSTRATHAGDESGLSRSSPNRTTFSAPAHQEEFQLRAQSQSTTERRPSSFSSLARSHSHSQSGSHSLVRPRSDSTADPKDLPTLKRPRSKTQLPKEATKILHDWIIANATCPYPTDAQKRELCEQTGLTHTQVSNWMINARRRILPPGVPITRPPRRGGGPPHRPLVSAEGTQTAAQSSNAMMGAGEVLRFVDPSPLQSSVTARRSYASLRDRLKAEDEYVDSPRLAPILNTVDDANHSLLKIDTEFSPHADLSSARRAGAPPRGLVLEPGSNYRLFHGAGRDDRRSSFSSSRSSTPTSPSLSSAEAHVQTHPDPIVRKSADSDTSSSSSSSYYASYGAGALDRSPQLLSSSFPRQYERSNLPSLIANMADPPRRTSFSGFPAPSPVSLTPSNSSTTIKAFALRHEESSPYGSRRLSPPLPAADLPLPKRRTLFNPTPDPEIPPEDDGRRPAGVMNSERSSPPRHAFESRSTLAPMRSSTFERPASFSGASLPARPASAAPGFMSPTLFRDRHLPSPTPSPRLPGSPQRPGYDGAVQGAGPPAATVVSVGGGGGGGGDGGSRLRTTSHSLHDLADAAASLLAIGQPDATEAEDGSVGRGASAGAGAGAAGGRAPFAPLGKRAF